MTLEEWQAWLEERRLFDSAWAAALSATLARTQWIAEGRVVPEAALEEQRVLLLERITLGLRQLDTERAHAILQEHGAFLRGRVKC
jgi:hypothetical protein